MTKRVLSLILILLMVLALFPACASAAPEEDGVHALLSDYLDYLYRTEQNDSTLLWACSYVKDALEGNDWTGILKARLAVSAANMYVSATELSGEQTSDEMYDAFLNRKQDVSFVGFARQGYALEKKTALDALYHLAYELESGIFSKSTVAAMKTHIKQLQEQAELELEYLAVSTDYLLNELGTSDTTEKFKKALSDDCPMISGYLNKETLTKEELEKRATEVLDAIEDVADRMNRLTSQMGADLRDLTYAYEHGDGTALAADRNTPVGLPDTLPFPLWEENKSETVYFQRDKDGQMCVPKPGDAITEAPAGCMLTYTGVKEDSVYDYMLLLIENGVDVKEDKVEDDSFEADCLYKGISFTVSWKDNTATITMPNGIVCLWLS